MRTNKLRTFDKILPHYILIINGKQIAVYPCTACGIEGLKQNIKNFKAAGFDVQTLTV